MNFIVENNTLFNDFNETIFKSSYTECVKFCNGVAKRWVNSDSENGATRTLYREEVLKYQFYKEGEIIGEFFIKRSENL